MVTLPLEIVAAAITIQYWNSPISPAVWVTIFLGAIILINLLGVKGYGETEFWMALVKVIAIIGFMYVITLPFLVSMLTRTSASSVSSLTAAEAPKGAT
jgi:amino acid permease